MRFYGQELNVFKTACHLHTNVSDGVFSPQQIIDFYREAGYDAIFLTDHRTTHDVSVYSSGGKMKIYSGAEVHPAGPRNINWHILALGVPHPFPGEFASGQEAVDQINSAGAAAFVAHPNWCGFTSAEVMTLQNTAGIEVYNTACRYIGKEFSMHTWDEMLDAGRMTYALATDDTHKPHDLTRSWTMICAGENTRDALVNALRNGEFYASQGPEIYSLSCENRVFKAEFSPCCSVVLVGKRSRGKCGCVPGDPAPEDNRTLTSVEFDLADMPENSFVRLQLKDANGNYAWSNPILI